MGVVMVGLSMLFGVGVRSACIQDPHRDKVNDQADHRHQDSLVEADRLWVEEAYDALPGHREGEDCQDDGAGEAGQAVDFAGAEAEAMVVGVFARIQVGCRRDAQRSGMG